MDLLSEDVLSAESLLRNRPILRPISPSKKVRRSPSPKRDLIQMMKHANPPTLFYVPGSEKLLPYPDVVLKLAFDLIQDPQAGTIPVSVKTYLEEFYRTFFPTIPSYAWSNSVEDFGDPVTLWEQIHKIKTGAERCYERDKDENSWVRVVWDVLEMAGLHDIFGMFEVVSVQSQNIDSNLLPKVFGQLPPPSTVDSLHVSDQLAPTASASNILPTSDKIPLAITINKKADLAVSFSPYHPEVSQAISSFHPQDLLAPISQMTDSYTSRVPLAVGIEVKKVSGNLPEGLAQVALWAASLLERTEEILRRTKKVGEKPEIIESTKESMPVLCIVVRGHDWNLYIAWINDRRERIVLGPISTGGCDTSTYVNIFMLRKLLVKVRKWLVETYWPWFRQDVLGYRMTAESE